jgi:hypothetical protein
MFTISMLYVMTVVFMAMTNQYADFWWRNAISFLGSKTSMLLTAIVFCRSTRGILSLFSMLLLIVCSVNLTNEILYVFKVCDTDSYSLIFVETVIVFFLIKLYKNYARG